MNELFKKTLTTLEVAEMMDVSHSDLLKKLEGRRDRKGYIQVISEGQLSVADYFIKGSYVDAQGKERPCYEVTKLGCDFLANKSTGEKGMLFTARYVKKFYEIENALNQTVRTEHPGEVANLIKVISNVMRGQGSSPHHVSENAQLICNQYGIKLISQFVKIPKYEQMRLSISNSNQITLGD